MTVMNLLSNRTDYLWKIGQSERAGYCSEVDRDSTYAVFQKMDLNSNTS